MNRYAIIMAAGKGSRMKSRNPEHSKVSYPILGKALVNYVIDAIIPLGLDETVVVVGFGKTVTESLVKDRAKTVWQQETKGTGHAVLQAASILENKKGQTLILCGDTPLIKTEMLEAAFKKHEKSGSALTIVSAVLEDPTGYGRILREKKSNKILAVREHQDCSEEEKYINEVNAGIYIVDNEKLFHYIKQVEPNNAANEYYLTDVIEMFVKDGLKVEAYVTMDPVSTYGINDRSQLAYAAKVIRKRVNHSLMMSGVSLEDPETTYISPDVKIGRDTIICPNTSIIGRCQIGEANIIGPNTYLENVTIGNDNKVVCAYLRNQNIGDSEYINPLDKDYANN